MPQRQVVVGGSNPTAARQGPVTHAAAAHAAATLVMCGELPVAPQWHT